MFEYTKEVLEKELENKIKEQSEIDARLNVLLSVSQVKGLAKYIFTTYSAGALGATFLAVSDSSIDAILAGCWFMATGLCVIMAPACYYLLKYNKSNPDIVRLSKNELKEINDELISKKKEINDSITNVRRDYESVLKLCEMTEEYSKKLDCFSYAMKNAKTEDEYIEMCAKQDFFENEWDKFVNEPINFRDIHLNASDAGDVKVRKLGSR